MRKISKSKLDKMIELTHLYDTTGTIQFVNERIELARDMEDRIGVTWLSICNLLDAILGCRSFSPDAKNMTIYCVLSVLDWEVVDDEVEASESL